ncbi:helix-turn-helix domain-containing protein [Nesterenkonia halobia]
MMDTSGSEREALLRALLDTAAELSSLQDVESVLQSIVRRTRHLLRAEMAYISLNDHPSGETYIRQSDGVATTAYRTLRMPVGYGILGRVATGVAPYQTTAYLHDDSIPHLESIDAIVAAEGVQTIMGVPLLVGGQVIGALMVAERGRRVFSPEEVDIVDSLGKHAAVALDNAERYSRALFDAEQLSREHERSQEELTSQTQVMEFDAGLLHEILRSPTEDGVLELTADTLGRPAALLSETGEQVAVTPPESGTLLEGAAASPAALRGEVSAGEHPVVLDGARGSVTAAPVTAGDSLMGFLVVEGAADAAPRQLLEHAAAHMALTLQFIRAEEDAQDRQQLDVVEDLLADRMISDHRLDQRLRRWQLSAHDRAWVAVVSCSQELEAPVRRLLRGMPGTRLTAPRGEDLCVVYTDPDWPRAADAALRTAGLAVRGATSGPMDSLRRLRRHHRTARMAVAAMRLGDRQGLLDAADVGLVGAVVHAAEQAAAHDRDPVELTDPIAPLTAQDAARGTELTRTAATFFETDRRIDRTAEALFVHRSTVKQRLQTIRRVLGDGWDRAPRSLDVHLALRAWSLGAEGQTSSGASLETMRTPTGHPRSARSRLSERA